MTEPLLLTVTQIGTFNGGRLLTFATGFFFRRGACLFLVTSRHVLLDPPNGHFPDRLEFKVHADAANLTSVATCSIPLYTNGQARWKQASDAGGDVDVAAIEIDPATLAATSVLRAFTPAHLQGSLSEVETGAPLLIVGFPLGFHDTLHHLPVVRQAVIASSFGLRFQGLGYFLTDARTHRGSSGAPVVMRAAASTPDLAGLPWKLLGVHSGRMDMLPRDASQDDLLGLNCAWYADVLLPLTEPGLRPQAGR